MKITGDGVSEDSVFAAGIAGFDMLKEKDGEWQSVINRFFLNSVIIWEEVWNTLHYSSWLMNITKTAI